MKIKGKNPEYIMKMGFVLIGVIVVLTIIVVSFVWELVFSPENFDVYKWATKAIFNGSIALAMMVLGFIAIEESMKSRENGRYQTRLGAFNDLVSALFDTGRVIYFDQFISCYAERQAKEKRISHLTRRGMPRMDAVIIIEYATIDDLPKLSGLQPGEKPKGEYGEDIIKTDKDGNEVLIPRINDTMVSYVEEAINGSITVDAENASYYMTSDRNRESCLTSLERAQATERDRVRSMRTAFITRIVVGLLYTTIFSLLVVDKNTGTDNSEAIWTLVLRIASATFGFISGGFAGSVSSRYSYKWLGDKMRVINEYNKNLDSGEFKPMSYAETAKERIEQVKARDREDSHQLVNKL